MGKDGLIGGICHILKENAETVIIIVSSGDDHNSGVIVGHVVVIFLCGVVLGVGHHAVLVFHAEFYQLVEGTCAVLNEEDLAVGEDLAAVVPLGAIKGGGTDGVAMAQGDVYSAIQTGTLDGAENNIITYVDLVQYEVAPYYNLTGHLMIPDELCIANDVLASMSEEDQAAFKQICNESIAYMFNLCAELRSDYEAKAIEQGVTISEADVPAFQAACADLITDVANRNDMTKSVYEAILSCR